MSTQPQLSGYNTGLDPDMIPSVNQVSHCCHAKGIQPKSLYFANTVPHDHTWEPIHRKVHDVKKYLHYNSVSIKVS